MPNKTRLRLRFFMPANPLLRLIGTFTIFCNPYLEPNDYCGDFVIGRMFYLASLEIHHKSLWIEIDKKTKN